MIFVEGEAEAGAEVGHVAGATEEIKRESTNKPKWLSEAILDATADIAVGLGFAVPRAARASHGIRARSPFVDGITEEEIPGPEGMCFGHAIVGVPRGFVANAEVAGKEVVHAEATTGTGLKGSAVFESREDRPRRQCKINQPATRNRGRGILLRRRPSP